MNLYFSDTTDRPGSREMTSISPEYILETKPKVIVEEINTGSSLMSGTLQTQTHYILGLLAKSGTQGYKTFFIGNSTEHEIYPAHKC